MFKLIAAWLCIGRRVWFCLGLGYAWVVLSFYSGFEEPASGAILLSCCVIAEIWHNSETWLKIANKALYVKVPQIESEAKTQIQVDIEKLMPFAFPYKDFGSNDWAWKTHDARDYVQKRIQIVLAVSAIFGSVLWGYGHRWFS